jgi:hypothetical protein
MQFATNGRGIWQRRLWHRTAQRLFPEGVLTNSNMSRPHNNCYHYLHFSAFVVPSLHTPQPNNS